MTEQSPSGPESEDWRGMTPCDRGLTAPMVDDVFGLLADWRRRTVCRYFVTTGSNSVHVDTLAAAVARRVSDDEIDASETREQAIRESLVHDHLPRMDEAGVLDFDVRSESVCYWGNPTLEKWAEHAEAVTDR
ncbi:hypothetical protein SAMN05216559_2343 [Halomicrobium zhouii]|uniref:DUF7344 domain-containing protein n=1 Tax=Halomicrobium zhouii TaxID=767519 RepID=A0A1I6LA84_9EURY|nr:hypothetical protein [Halomicrobium zhouii]SFS00314.1 hypothetical protein SAMN05216559_2343 [Halomicrobium zhouii]